MPIFKPLSMVLVACAIVGAARSQAWAQTASSLSQEDRDAEVRQLRELVLKLQARVEQLEAHEHAVDPSPPRPPGPSAAAESQAVAAPSPSQPAEGSVLDFLKATTIDLGIDGYYGYNFNSPIGRVNLLRAYDVSSNAFSLNQATVVIESAADPARGKRWGARFDLQFGQATATLQGNPTNEPRAAIYRNVFQAYGTYVFPVAKGLTVDFGKWASSLGYESNYTKDQINYSRSYWFNFLPFYHMGVRAAFKPKDWLSINYWIVNGTQQTEPFNGYKDQAIGFNAQNKKWNWTATYYRGQEHPGFEFVPLPVVADSGLPSIQGMPFRPIRPAPDGRLHIVDTYASWQATSKLQFVVEGDYVVQRFLRTSPPMHASGGALYGRYEFSPKFAIGARTE